jgi:acyl dehydratase
MSANDDWAAAWQPMVAAIGTQFDPGPHEFTADVIEASAVRRYLEPLEFACPLHHDRAVAQAHGHPDILVPTSAIPTFAMAPMWRPGELLFDSAERNAQPANTPISGIKTGLEPPTTGFFATNYDVEYLRPAHVGDRLLRRGARLMACRPKDTKVGRGAFLTWESEIVNQRLDLVARLQTTYFRYNPHGNGYAA